MGLGGGGRHSLCVSALPENYTQNLFSLWSNQFHAGKRGITQASLLTIEIIFSLMCVRACVRARSQIFLPSLPFLNELFTHAM